VDCENVFKQEMLYFQSCLTEHSAETALLKVTNDLHLAQFSGLIFALFDLRVHSALDSLEHSLPEIQSHFDFFNFGLFFFCFFSSPFMIFHSSVTKFWCSCPSKVGLSPFFFPYTFSLTDFTL